MVLSLAFILAFIGAAVALLIGILIFSEVSDSLVCPAGGTIIPGTIGGFANQGTLGGLAHFYNQTVQDEFVVTTGPTNLGQAVTDFGADDGGVDAEIELLHADKSSLNFLHGGLVGSNSTSVNFWINGDVSGAPHYPMLGNINCESGTPGWCIEANSGTTRVRVAETTGYVIDNAAYTGEPPDDSNWHMVTVVMDKGNTTGNWMTICIDASCSAAGAVFQQFTGTVSDSAFNMTAGGGETARGDHITFGVQNGADYDDIVIWDGYELTQSDITTLYNSGDGSSSAGVGSSFQKVRFTFDVGTELDAQGESFAGAEQGSEECEGAKDTAWTVIGILPVALFFALFAIFGSLGRQN